MQEVQGGQASICPIPCSALPPHTGYFEAPHTGYFEPQHTGCPEDPRCPAIQVISKLHTQQVVTSLNTQQVMSSLNWEGCRESRRCSRVAFPESYITKYTGIRRLIRGSDPVLGAAHPCRSRRVSEQGLQTQPSISNGAIYLSNGAIYLSNGAIDFLTELSTSGGRVVKAECCNARDAGRLGLHLPDAVLRVAPPYRF